MKCIKCGKEHKNMFKQWVANQSLSLESDECYICEDCIKDDKSYIADTCYCENSDMTFIFAVARVLIDENTHKYALLSQTLIGYVYGNAKPNDPYVKWALGQWAIGNRVKLLRQSYNENNKMDEEVLY